MSMIGNLVELTSGQLAQLQQGDVAVSDFLHSKAAGGPLRHQDLDKAWHAIHFLLTGETWEGEGPASQAIMGGQPLGDEDVGYGPARYLLPEEVVEISGVLESISVSDLHQKYVPADLEAASIYPTGIWEDEGEEAFDYVRHYYETLVAFYKTCAANGNPALLYLN